MFSAKSRSSVRCLSFLGMAGLAMGAVAESPAQVLHNVETHASRLVNNRSILIDPDGVSLIEIHDQSVADHTGVVAVYTRDAGTGALGLLESHQQGLSGVAGLDLPFCGVFSPDGTHLYVGGGGDDAISIFDRDPHTGHMEYADRLASQPTLNWVRDLAVSADGAVVYALSSSLESITVFAREPATGGLTPIQDFSTHPVGFANPLAIKLSPDGAHLYVGLGPKIGVLDIDPASGTLNYLDTTVAPLEPTSLAMSPDGNHLYVGGGNDDAVAVYSRNPTDGRLTFVEVLEHGTGGITSLRRVASVDVTPDGSQVVVSAISDAITVFDRNPVTGELTVAVVFRNGVNGVRGLDGAHSVAISTDGENVYALGDRDKAITTFDRNPATGVIAFSSVSYDGLGAFEAHLGGRVIETSPDGGFVYTGTDTLQGGVLILQRSTTDGRLLYRGRETEDLEEPTALVVSPDGDHLYVSEDHRLTVFERNRITGLLEFIEQHVEGSGGVSGLDDSKALAISSDGANLYVASTFGPQLAVFARDPESGELSFLEAHQDGAAGIDGLSEAEWVALSPDGSNLYVASAGDNAVAVFDRDPLTGLLTFLEAQIQGVDGVIGLRGCRSVALSPDGTNLYAAGPISSSVANFARDSGTGRLSYLGKKSNGFGGVFGLEDPRTVVVTPDGNWVVAGSVDDDALVVFSRDPVAGTLRFVETLTEVFPDASDRIGPTRLATSGDGRSIYAVGQTYNTARIGVYRFGSDVSDGVPVQNPGIIGWRTYRIEVPSCADRLDVEVFDLNRNGDLFTRFDAMPSITDHDCASTNPETTPESCTHLTPGPGTWWIAVASPPTGNPLRFTLLATIGGCSGQDFVSWWPADDDPMDPVGGNHGIPEGGLDYTDGMIGRAFDLDGIDDAVLVPHDPSLDAGDGDFTISLWVKTDDGDASLLDWRGAAPFRGFHVFLDHGRPAFTLGDGSVSAGAIADRGIADGRFHHLSVSIQRTALDGGRILIDGRDTHESDHNPVTGSLDTAEDLTIGRGSASTGGTEHLTGSLDEIKLYHRALPQREAVNALGSLIGWWPADGNTFDRGGTNHGVGYPAYTQGRWAQAFAFSPSSDPMTIPNDHSLGIGTGDLAVSCWIWSDGVAGEQTIIDSRDAGGTGYRFFLDEGRPAIELDDGAQTAGVTSTVVVTDGRLHHLVFSVDRDAPDGGSISIDALPDTIFDPSSVTGDVDTLEDLTIGRDTVATGSQHSFIGGIDDLQLHNAPLTPTQIEWLFASEGLLFLDGFEIGGTGRWAVTVARP